MQLSGEKLKLVDKAFAFIERRWWQVLIGVLLSLVAAWQWQADLIAGVKPAEPFFKMLATVFGAPLAAFGFYLGYRSKRDMVKIHQSSTAQLSSMARDNAEVVKQAATLEERLGARERQLERSTSSIKEQEALLKTQGERVALLETNLRRVAESGHELWKASTAAPFPEYELWSSSNEGARILTVGNLKGGVGKTTLAANLAAYAAERVPQKPVLLIDLDYQGSLSNMMMFAADKREVPSHAEWLLGPDANFETLLRAKLSLNPKLPNASLVPASYTLANSESGYLLKWLMEPHGASDARYRLARILLDPVVRREFSLIILDMPPRMTLAGINALVASHALVVPALMDRMSTEAVQQFLTMVREIKTDLKLAVELLGTVGMLTIQDGIHTREQPSWNDLSDAGRVWSDREYRFKRNIPRKVAISAAAGSDIAYVSENVGDRSEAREFFTPLFDEIWARLYPVPIPLVSLESSPQEPAAMPAT